ncbi:fumarylacetoacetate hydrolase family protein [Streptomyces sp. NPDC005122]
MRFVSFGPRHVESPGILLGDSILDVRRALARRGHHAIGTLTDLLALPYWREIATVLVEQADLAEMVPVSDTRIGPPVPRPGQVILMGANTFSHVREASVGTDGTPPRRPMAVGKAPGAVVGPTDDIVQPLGAGTVDYEVELGVVIGTVARHVPVERALDVIAGVTVVNDMSDRDLQSAVHEDNNFYRGHYLGKSYDGFCPTGPALVTTDELNDLREPAAIRLRSWVNDELRQDADLEDLVFDVPRIVSYLSTIMSLMPGDLICTGSPAGVGAFQEPPAYLRAGDRIRTEITGLGGTANLIVTDTSTPTPTAEIGDHR